MVGTERGYLTLRAALQSDIHVCGVICFRQHAHETDRYELQIAELARGAGVPFHETTFLRERDYADLIRSELKPDIAYLIGVRILVPAGVYEAIPWGAIAAHDSLLPLYRGFAPLNWSILNGESETGVTLFRIQGSVDDGPIVAQSRIPIGDADDAREVYDRVCRSTTELVIASYHQACSGGLTFVEQDRNAATYTCSRRPADGLIDWGRPTRSIFDQVRALADPFPGAFTYFRGRKLMVWKARPVDNAPSYVGRIPGRVVAIHRDCAAVDVLTGDGILQLIEVGWESSKRVSAADIVTSVRASLGLDVTDLMERLDQLERTLEAVRWGGARNHFGAAAQDHEPPVSMAEATRKDDLG